MHTSIGLEPKKVVKLAEELNELLANYQLFYINARGFHWNITGEKFFELHVKFEEIYNDAIVKIDEIAERVRTLGETPLHSFSDYLEKSEIPEVTGVADGRKAIKEIVQGLQVILRKERELLKRAKDIDDEGTITLITDYIIQQEKLVWMYSAYLK